MCRHHPCKTLPILTPVMTAIRATQLAETYSTGTGEDGNRPLSLITYAEAEPAHLSDTRALPPMLDKVEEQGIKPEKLLADTPYGSDDNCQYAKQKDVELISPAKPSGHPEKPVTLAMFSFDDHGVVLSCPAGFAPVRIHHNVKKERISASFSCEACANCDKRDDCPTQPAKKGRYLRYRYKDIRLLRRRARSRTSCTSSARQHRDLDDIFISLCMKAQVRIPWH